MRSILTFCVVLAALTGCSITPPGSLAEAKKKHAEELQAVELSRERIRKKAVTLGNDLAECKSALEDEQEYRTYDARAVAYMQWCDAGGSVFGMCNDRLYSDGEKAYTNGESASFWWQLLYFVRSAVIAGIALGIAIAIPLKLWIYVRRKGALRILDTIRIEQERLASRETNLQEKLQHWSSLKESTQGLEHKARDLERTQRRTVSHLEYLLSRLESARAELQEIRRLRDTLDI